MYRPLAMTMPAPTGVIGSGVSPKTHRPDKCPYRIVVCRIVVYRNGAAGGTG